MGFRKRQRGNLTDYRKVSESVHERRAELSRNSETLRESPEAAEAAVRTYRPAQRLRDVDRDTQQLVEDSRDVPRIWDSDVLEHRQLWSIETHYILLLILNLFVGWFLFLAALQEPAPSPRQPGVNGPSIPLVELIPMAAVFVIIAMLAAGAIIYWRVLGNLAWVGLVVSTVEFAAFFVLVSQSY